MASTMRSEITELSDNIAGEALTPASPRFEEARQVWNGTIVDEPAIIVRCKSVDDVVEAIGFARDNDLQVSIRGGGHNVAGTALVEGGLVIDLSEMKAVEVDPEAKIARVQGGATLGDVDRATNAHGLVTPSGFISETGIAGLTLRGGFGHTMRCFGLACDNLEAVELVTSSGEVLSITEESDPDALWALRGGPLDLGVVTEFVFRLHEIPSEVRLLLSAFPVEKGTEINRFMRDYIGSAPRELGLISFYVTLPDDEEYPEQVQGREVVVLFGMYIGERSEADAVLSPILNHDDLITDLGGWMTYPEAQSALDEDYPDGLRYYWKSLYLDELDDDVLRAIHRLGTERPSPDSTLDVWNLGGAVAEVDPQTSAFPQRDAPYMIAIEANWGDPADDAENIAWARKTFQEIEEFSNGGIYMNFAGSRQEHDDAVASVYSGQQSRLVQTKERLDPIGLFGSRGSR